MNIFSRFFLMFLILAILLCVIGSRPACAEKPVKFDKDIRPLLEKYCYKCHNKKEKKGKLVLTGFKKTSELEYEEKILNKMISHLEEEEMPPEKEKNQPSDEERQRLVSELEKVRSQVKCDRVATDENKRFYRGYVMSRRLNRAEYNNTLRDLFGLDIRPADAFPKDGSGGEGFDNNGDALFISPIHMEKYLDAADRVVEAALADGRKDSPAYRKIFITWPSGKVKPRGAAQKILSHFSRRAFRRPISQSDLKSPLTMFDRAQARGDSFEASVKLALKTVLVSPHFLFLPEPQPPQEGVYQLGAFPLASRLSYFLWSSMPDEQLLKLAESGKLLKTDVLKQQVHRMLKNRRSRSLAENFALQWLGVATLGQEMSPDPKRYPEFDEELLAAMREESVLLFDEIFRNNRSVLDLIDADYTYLNERLAKHYAIKGVRGSKMRRVKLPDRNRGGIVGLGSVLTATSYPMRTSPVLRGKWVLETALGSVMKPPPVLNELKKIDSKKAKSLSLRQRFELHRSKAECASCHNRLDPPGFGLENFDAIGRWRTKIEGKPVDASGKFSTGETFVGPAELKKVLLKHREKFTKSLTRKMLGYALGRELNKFDYCIIKDTYKILESDNFRAVNMVEQIVLSYPFRHRYSKQ